ncbi:MAG TPA: hypothetical protein VK911_03245 [Vicinamibacterales bacterium]|nr:hypothetical protein [Vicinamibacterales bacterium]
MKQTLILSLGALFVLASLATVAEAQTPPPGNPTTPAVGVNFIDANGDGICDNFQNGNRMGPGQGQGKGMRKGKGYGPGDGTGTSGIGPRDGTGFGKTAGAGAGTGVCDGTGPKGQGRGRGARVR